MTYPKYSQEMNIIWEITGEIPRGGSGRHKGGSQVVHRYIIYIFFRFQSKKSVIMLHVLAALRYVATVCALASPLVSAQTCEKLHFSLVDRDGNTLTGICRDIANDLTVSQPRILLNGTTPPARCFNISNPLGDNITMEITFSADCEGEKRHARIRSCYCHSCDRYAIHVGYLQCEKDGHLSSAHILYGEPDSTKYELCTGTKFGTKIKSAFYQIWQKVPTKCGSVPVVEWVGCP